MPLSRPTYHTYISQLLSQLYLLRSAYSTYCTYST